MATATAVPATELYERAVEKVRVSEAKLKELRREHLQTETDLGALRARRQEAVKRGDHRAINAFEDEIRLAERELERQQLLIQDADAELQKLSNDTIPLATRAQRETIALRVRELEEKGSQLVATFNEEVWCRGHKMLAELLDLVEELQRLGPDGSIVASRLFEGELIPMGNALVNRGWRLRRFFGQRFTMHAAFPPV